jgi:hypothetical protein
VWYTIIPYWWYSTKQIAENPSSTRAPFFENFEKHISMSSKNLKTNTLVPNFGENTLDFELYKKKTIF